MPCNLALRISYLVVIVLSGDVGRDDFLNRIRGPRRKPPSSARLPNDIERSLRALQPALRHRWPELSLRYSVEVVENLRRSIQDGTINVREIEEWLAEFGINDD